MSMDELIAEVRIELQRHPENTYDILIELFREGQEEGE